MVKKRIKKCESCTIAKKKTTDCMTCPEQAIMQKKVAVVMGEFKKGELHAGHNGPEVTNPKQALAIALSMGRKKVKKNEK